MRTHPGEGKAGRAQKQLCRLPPAQVPLCIPGSQRAQCPLELRPGGPCDTRTVERKSLPGPHPTRCHLVNSFSGHQSGVVRVGSPSRRTRDPAHVEGGGPSGWWTAVKRDASSPDITLRASKLDDRQGSARSHMALRPIRFAPGPRSRGGVGVAWRELKEGGEFQEAS